VQKIVILIWISSISFSLVSPTGPPGPNAQRHYCDPIMPLLVGGIIGPQEKTLVFSVRTKDAKIPEPGPKLEIYSKNGTIVLQSDADGYVKYPFSVALIKENPALRKLNEKLTFELRLTSVTKPGIKQRIELSVGDKPFMACESCRVWYSASHEKEAEEILRNYRKHIHSYMMNSQSNQPPGVSIWLNRICPRSITLLFKTSQSGIHGHTRLMR